MTLHGLGLLFARLNQRNEFDASLHDKEVKTKSYATDDQVADFFSRLGK